MMPTDPTTSRWKRAAQLFEPSVTADSTISGSALTILFTGLEACLEGSSAPMVAGRIAALSAELDLSDEAGELAMRHTVRGFSRVQEGGTVTVVIIAGGRPTVLAPTPNDDGSWYEEFDIPLVASPASTYPITIVVSSSRHTERAVACAGVDSLDLLLIPAARTAQAEEDPAAPTSGADLHDAPLTNARSAANFGVEPAPDTRAA